MAAQASIRLKAAAAAGGAAEALLLLALMAAPWPYGGAPDAARYLLAAACAVGAALWALSRLLEAGGVPAGTLAALALPAVAVLQLVAARSVAPGRTFDAALLLVAFAGTLGAWLDRTRERGSARRLATALIVVCVAQAAFAMVQWSLSSGSIYGRRTEEITAPFGSFVNHNHFAALVETGVLLAAGLTWGWYRVAGRPTPRVLLMGGLALVLAAAELASGSRGGVLALLSGALGLLALRLVGPGAPRADWRRALPAVAVGGVLVAALVMALVSPQARARVGSLARGTADRSGAYRVDTARATLALSASRPLAGSGFGAFEDALPPFKKRHGEVRTTHAESDLLELLAEGGLLGAGAAALLGIVLWRALADRLRHRHERERRWLALAAAAASVAVLAHSMIDFGLRLPAVALALAAVLGLAGAPRERRGYGGFIAALALCALFAGAGALGIVRARGAMELARARALPDPQLRAAALADVVLSHPRLAEAHRARALSLAAVAAGDTSGGRLSRAGRELQEALRSRPRWSAAWADLGWVRERTGDVEGARQAYDEAVRLDPASGGIGLARVGFLLRRSEGDRALADLARLWAYTPGRTPEEVLEAARRLTSDPSFLERVGRLPAP